MDRPRAARATAEDVDEIAALYEDELRRPADRGRLTDLIAGHPAAVTRGEAGRLTGFCYCERWAPDVIEVLNILVDPCEQSRGAGASMLALVEAESARLGFAAVVAVNSSLYPPMRHEFRDGTAFYTRNGYRLAFQTAATNVFVKDLR